MYKWTFANRGKEQISKAKQILVKELISYCPVRRINQVVPLSFLHHHTHHPFKLITVFCLKLLSMLQVRGWRGLRVGVIYYSNNPATQSIVQCKTWIPNGQSPFVSPNLHSPVVFFWTLPTANSSGRTSASPSVFFRTVFTLEASHIENYSLGTNGEAGIFSVLWLNYSLRSSIQGPVGLL